MLDEHFFILLHLLLFCPMSRLLVCPRRFELLTPWLKVKCSTVWATGTYCQVLQPLTSRSRTDSCWELNPFLLDGTTVALIGRSDRIWTCGIYIPNVALYQLSHTPIFAQVCILVLIVLLTRCYSRYSNIIPVQIMSYKLSYSTILDWLKWPEPTHLPIWYYIT